MAYEYITKFDSPNYNSGRQGHKVKYIVIHHWGADGQSFQGVVSWLCRANGSSSAHYVVEAGKVACIVSPEDTAWHAGNWNYNLESIGIECRPEMSDGDFATTAELVANIWKDYGKLPIIGHRDIVATACPGRYYKRLGELKSLAERLYNGEEVTLKPQWIKDDKGWWYKHSDGSYPAEKWELIDGTWYYFNSDGYGRVGWLHYEDKWYYLDSDCKMVTGWKLINGKWYFFNKSGDMKEGWVKYSNKWYYLKPSAGDMVSDEFRKVGDYWYKFDETGAMLEDTKLDVEPSGIIR